MSKGKDSDLHHWVKSNIPIVVALVLSCLVIPIISSLAHENVSRLADIVTPSIKETSRWNWFFELPPNAMGDTLAGLLGALTLVWIIASVFHQSRELAEQREIMREQRKEFELMVQAQNAQVEALRAQTALLDEERKDRAERARSAELDQMFTSLSNICELASNYTIYNFLRDADDFGGLLDENGNFLPKQERIRFHLFKIGATNTLDEKIFQYAKSVFSFQIFLQENDRFSSIELRRDTGLLQEVVSNLKGIEDFANGAGRVVKARVTSAFIPQMRDSLERVLELDMWALSETESSAGVKS